MGTEQPKVQWAPPNGAPTLHVTLRLSDNELMRRVCKAREIGPAEFVRRLFDHARDTQAPLVKA
jgi:hypothetical protein